MRLPRTTLGRSVIAVDSSVLIRYLAQDDEDQAALATRLFEHELTPADPGLVTVTALLETSWVLRRVYGQDWGAIYGIVARLIAAPNLVIEHADAVALAIEARARFADALIHLIGKQLGADRTITFDRKFARMDGVELLG